MTINGRVADVRQAVAIYRKVMTDQGLDKRTFRFFYHPSTGPNEDYEVRFETPEEFRTFFRDVAKAV